MTKFEQAIENWQNGTLKVPKVIAEGGQEVNPVAYQLIVQAGYLWLMTKGITNKQVNVKYFKDFYGFTGRSAADIWPQFVELYEKYLGKKPNYGIKK